MLPLLKLLLVLGTADGGTLGKFACLMGLLVLLLLLLLAAVPFNRAVQHVHCCCLYLLAAQRRMA